MYFDQARYDEALHHYQNGRFADAVDVLVPLLQASPAHVEVLNLAAICCHGANCFDDAEAHWRRAIEECPAYAAAYGNLGNLLTTRGKPSDAEAVYRQAISVNPAFAQAHYNLGNLLLRLGRSDEAEASLREAIRLQPALAEAHYNLANLLKEHKRIEEAETAFRHAIAVRPDYAEAFNNLGNLLREAGRPHEARRALRRAVALRPAFVEALSSLGHLLRERARPARAAVLFSRAATLQPHSVDARCALGHALLELGRMQDARDAFAAAISLDPNCVDALIGLASAFEREQCRTEAVQAYRRVIAVEPGNARVHGALACVLHGLGQLAEAEQACRNALGVDPRFAEVRYNLGLILSDQHRLPEAEHEYREAIALRPDYVEAHTNLGRILRDQQRLHEAEAILRDSLAIRDDVAETHNNLASVLKDMGRMDEAIASFRQAVRCNPDNERVHRNLNYALTYQAETSRELLDECTRFTAHHEAPFLVQPVAHANTREPRRRLNIGYVAPDFSVHCQSMFTAPVFAHHDHANFKIVCYSSVEHSDDITHMLRPMADLWRDVHHLDDAQLADLIRADEIDVLVDLTLHMSRGRPLLFARRPAPVQVQWLAYPGTTGSRAIGYRLSDPWIDPPDRTERDAFYSERIVHLPDTFWCFDPRVTSPDAPDVSVLPASSNGFITFGCLNNPCKASERTLRMWAAVLGAVPDARFILLAGEGPREHYRARLSALGVDLSRIEFVGYQARVDYLQMYGRIDIGLDTYPYNGHTTSLDALWMGVPVPSRAGETAVSRAGLSLLSNLGLPELVATDDDSYVDIVTRLANDRSRLTALRSGLRARMEHSPMMDAARFTRNLEGAFRQIWEGYCEA